MKQSIETIKEMLNEHIEASKKYLANLEAVKYDTTYSEEGKENTRASLKKLYTETAIMKRDKILEAIKEMKGKEKTSIDLTDNRLSNAVSLINSLGENTPDNILRDIEMQFAGDQASLNALKGAYEKNNISTLAIDKKIYNVKSIYDELSQGIYDDFKNPEKIGVLNNAFLILNNIDDANKIESPADEGININTLPQII